jgi:gas vesicle protein
MGKKGLCTGIILGASIGALVSLLNGDTREYVKDTSKKIGDQASFYAQNPSIGVNQVKKGVVTLNQVVNSNTESALNALGQIDSSLTKFLK